MWWNVQGFSGLRRLFDTDLDAVAEALNSTCAHNVRKAATENPR